VSALWLASWAGRLIKDLRRVGRAEAVWVASAGVNEHQGRITEQGLHLTVDPAARNDIVVGVAAARRRGLQPRAPLVDLATGGRPAFAFGRRQRRVYDPAHAVAGRCDLRRFHDCAFAGLRRDG
jgi:hypothetical protein